MIISEYTNAQSSIIAMIEKCENVNAEYERIEKRYKEALAYEDYTVSESLREELDKLAKDFAIKLNDLYNLKDLIDKYLMDD